MKHIFVELLLPSSPYVLSANSPEVSTPSSHLEEMIGRSEAHFKGELFKRNK